MVDFTTITTQAIPPEKIAILKKNKNLSNALWVCAGISLLTIIIIKTNNNDNKG